MGRSACVRFMGDIGSRLWGAAAARLDQTALVLDSLLRRKPVTTPHPLSNKTSNLLPRANPRHEHWRSPWHASRRADGAEDEPSTRSPIHGVGWRGDEVVLEASRNPFLHELDMKNST